MRGRPGALFIGTMPAKPQRPRYSSGGVCWGQKWCCRIAEAIANRAARPSRTKKWEMLPSERIERPRAALDQRMAERSDQHHLDRPAAIYRQNAAAKQA